MTVQSIDNASASHFEINLNHVQPKIRDLYSQPDKFSSSRNRKISSIDQDFFDSKSPSSKGCILSEEDNELNDHYQPLQKPVKKQQFVMNQKSPFQLQSTSPVPRHSQKRAEHHFDNDFFHIQPVQIPFNKSEERTSKK